MRRNVYVYDDRKGGRIINGWFELLLRIELRNLQFL